MRTTTRFRLLLSSSRAKDLEQMDKWRNGRFSKGLSPVQVLENESSPT